MPRMPWTITREMFLSSDEVGGLLLHLDRQVRRSSGEAHLSAQFDRLIILTLLYSGIRTSELCGLRLGDIDRRPALHVRLHGRIVRTVYIPESVHDALTDYIQTIRPHWLPDGTRRDDRTKPIFHHERGRPFERTGLYRRVVRILTEAGLGRRASVQLLRHTYGYLAYRNTGGNLLFVQRQLGHAHPMITSVYSQFAEESYADLADRVANPPAVIEPRRKSKGVLHGRR